LAINNYELAINNYDINNYEMKNNNIIQQKSFAFAIRIVNLYKFLTTEKKEYVLSKQLLRSGTSVGANIEESIGGQSDKDFLSKISIAYKEARESVYWLKLLQATDYLSEEQADSLLKDAEELCKIIGKIQITIKTRNS
jgi:four helix bundle protein